MQLKALETIKRAVRSPYGAIGFPVGGIHAPLQASFNYF